MDHVPSYQRKLQEIQTTWRQTLDRALELPPVLIALTMQYVDVPVPGSDILHNIVNLDPHSTTAMMKMLHSVKETAKGGHRDWLWRLLRRTVEERIFHVAYVDQRKEDSNYFLPEYECGWRWTVEHSTQLKLLLSELPSQLPALLRDFQDRVVVNDFLWRFLLIWL
jgi:hypothetical protein